MDGGVGGRGVREAGQGLGGGGARAGLGGRDTGPQGRSKFRNVCRFFVVSNAYKKKDALSGEGGTHRSWPGGRGGRLRALVAGKGG